jgi:uncharacterized protein YutE (UPF0331/DUF86 family)
MTALDLHVLADRAAAVERHLARVQSKLPTSPDAFQLSTDASDAVVRHRWQAVQIVIELAVSLCVRLNLGAPASYADAFGKLANAGHLDRALVERLARAAGFRNVVAHAYEAIDMTLVYGAALQGPADRRSFLACARDIARVGTTSRPYTFGAALAGLAGALAAQTTSSSGSRF